MPLSNGTRLGPYEIRGPLGAGGMGVVYRAFDTRLQREIALKTLPEAFSRDDSLRARFEHEALAASALNHPNIVSVYDIGTDQGVLYMITELVAGESLRQLIARGPVAARKLVEIGKQIADGLAAAHSVGVVHRDIKPENILITADERIKIIDFGVAKQFAARAAGAGATAETQTLPGVVVGTIGYMSPEQIRGQALDGRSDIFSLGIVLHEMATGKSAFRGASGPDVMSAILISDPPPIEGMQIPPGLGLIISRCLEKESSRRFQNASDLAFAIRSLSAVSTTPNSNALPAIERKSRVRPVWAVSDAGLIAVVAAAYWFSLPPRTKPALTEPARPAAPARPAPPDAPVSKTPAAQQAAAPAVPPPPAAIGKTAKAVPPAQPSAAEAEAHSTRAADLVVQGQKLSTARKYQDAVSAFSEALLLRPRAVAALIGRGNAYLALQQFDPAIADFTRVLELQPGLAHVHDSRGRALTRQGQLDRALQDYNEAIRLKPDLALSYSNRGHLYNQKGEYKLALQDFDEAIRLNPDAINAYEGRAQARFRTGDRAGAAADRKQAARLRH